MKNTLAIIALVLSGCANSVGTDGALRAPASALTTSNSSSLLAGPDASQSCSLDSNILNSDDSYGVFQFQACSYDDDLYSVKLGGDIALPASDVASGATMPKAICIFPAQVYHLQSNPVGNVANEGELVNGATDQVVFKPDFSGQPMSKCFTLPKGATGIKDLKVTFDKTQFDYLYVSSIENKVKMSQCLLTGALHLCPHHSAGQFRSLPSSVLNAQ
jgi:hypothetical protein